MYAARRSGAGEVDAEDIAQEAMLEFWPVWPNVARPEAWLAVAVRHRLYHMRRRRGKRARIHSEFAGDASLEASSPAETCDAEIEVLRVLIELAPRSRHLLELVLAGYTHRQIAAILGCQIHQVGPRVQRALQTARRRLTERSRSSSKPDR